MCTQHLPVAAGSGHNDGCLQVPCSPQLPTSAEENRKQLSISFIGIMLESELGKLSHRQDKLFPGTGPHLHTLTATLSCSHYFQLQFCLLSPGRWDKASS